MTNPDLILHLKKSFELKVYGFFRHISIEISEIKRIKGQKISKANFGVLKSLLFPISDLSVKNVSNPKKLRQFITF